ncbi:DAB adaptor protein isoform X2 [Lycorma delicatula]|uniref:DAB adaptor protein isoform X2 n=1 Tax=Lycorma delicatula TaxID=130591 RepID=UPI003F51830A
MSNDSITNNNGETDTSEEKSEGDKVGVVVQKDSSVTLANIKANLRSFSTLTRKSNEPLPDKNEPSRFLGDGVSYRAKLIGILEVSEARGDRMCQEALADLKMAIRAAGEHKQRITINIAIDGLRLRDDKTGDCLYHHPVHKISFIAQDMTDSRAFGYIFGSPDTGHRFFGIKTDKAASQVVISMRDLFQVVFELKKKEIEMAKQHIEQHQIKYGMGILPETPQKVAPDSTKMRTISEDSNTVKDSTATRKTGDKERSEGTSEAIADLLDLELELNSIQQGISQMERITPSDPFGDSFAPPPVTAKLPPPPTKSSTSSATSTSAASSTTTTVTPASAALPSVSTLTAGSSSVSNKSWFNQDTDSLFDESNLPPTSSTTIPPAPAPATPPPKVLPDTETVKEESTSSKDQFDVFTELDPLGTGRSKPYIDKKDFFQELKNPPKKVLKDLVCEAPKETNPPLFQATFDNDTTGTLNGIGETPPKQDPLFPVTISSDPFGDDPFDKTDPFAESNFSRAFFPNISENQDPFDTCFADFTTFTQQNDVEIADSISVESKNRKSPLPTSETSDSSSLHGPLRVSLPPEKQNSTSPRSRNRYSRTGSLVKLPSPKQKSRSRISKQTTVDSAFDRSNSPVMEGVTLRNCGATTSPPTVGFLESAPDPPPRPSSSTPAIKPPPLPPKRQIAMMTNMKPPFKPPHYDYDYIENYETSNAAMLDLKSPPLPVPARRPRLGGEGDASAPQRPTKHAPTSETEYYLTPFPLLPPPIKKGTSPKSESLRPFESTDISSGNNTGSKLPQTTCSLDITLSQLTKTGFSDLAATLGMSPTSLSKMTLQELTKCLQTITSENENKTNEEGAKIRANLLKSEQYSALRESIEEDMAPFKAEFDTHFNIQRDETVNTQEESLFDKYAVFRELLEQEKSEAETKSKTLDEVEETEEQKSEPVCAENNEKKEEEEKVINNVTNDGDFPQNSSEGVTDNASVKSVTEDRYAALREISLDDLITEEENNEDSKGAEDEDEEEAEADGSPSRQHSESTESPTATMKEPQSILETTIMEEDVSALEGDEDEVPEEVMGEMELTLPTVAESNESIDVSDSPVHQIETGSLPSLKEDLIEDQKDQINKQTMTISSLVEGWAKFDNAVEKTSEGNVSPWSVDSKDLNKEMYWREQRPERKVRKSRKHKVSQDDWDEDEESEEGWRSQHSSWDEPPWRENGWSDGDSLYDEPPPVPYHTQRRGRRRRVSPWRKTSRDPSPWEDEDRESQWEDSRWVDDYRPKHRGSSWDEERRKRRPSPWGGESDRRSSRESLNWEDDDKYSRRNYRDRRHRDRRWEDQGYSRSRDYREQGRRNYQYYRDRSHESPWEDSEQGEEDSPRCQTRKQAWARHSGRHDSEEEGYRYSRNDSRKSQTLRAARYRKHGQTSPFEDDFSSHSFQFPNDSKSPGSDASEHYIKHSPVQSKPQSSPDYFFKRKECSQFSESTSQKSHEFLSRTPQEGKPITPKGSHRQSPFEDDFTPPETRRYSGRSVSSDVSDKRGSRDDLKSNDDVFVPESNRLKSEKQVGEFAISLRKGRNLNGDLSQSVESVSPLSEGVSKRISDKRTKEGGDLKGTETISPSGDMTGRRNIEKRQISENKFGESDSPTSEMLKRRQGSEAESPSNDSVRRRQAGELKFRVSNLRRTDSSSSLRKSESVNIFARNSDPFDDDEFFSSESSTLPRSTKEEKPKSNNQDPFKWAEAFNAFNFENTTSVFFDEERK